MYIQREAAEGEGKGKPQVMEMTRVKSEESLGRRRICMTDAEVQTARCVKRRRRDLSVVTLSSDDQSQQQPLPNQQHEQASAATTVKRSSRFRGVSRWSK